MHFRSISRLVAAVILAAFIQNQVDAHNGPHASVHDTVAGILDRLKRQGRPEELAKLNEAQILAQLTPQERGVLSSNHIYFEVNQPVEVLLVTRHTPFWVEERGFRREEVKLAINGESEEYAVWRRSFPKGEVMLGVNSIGSASMHYVIAIRPRSESVPLEIAELYPGQLRSGKWEEGVSVYADRNTVLDGVPAGLGGTHIVQTLYGRRNDARLTGHFRITDYPATDRPDQIVLTWSDDPRYSQTIQWRTSTNVSRGRVAYQKQSMVNRFRPVAPMHADAKVEAMTDEFLVNDPVCHRFTAELRDLEPGTTYVYSVGDGTEDGWTEWAEFRTAPARVVPFSFVYMGDAQNGLHRWGSLVRGAFRERPDAAFYVMAGDLVNRGNARNDWDEFFFNAAGVFDRRTLVPAIGNHENQGGHPTMYLANFALLKNGAPGIEQERSYAFEYSNALIVVLDTNLDPRDQMDWLDRVLGASEATWKFVVYHHPAYSSAPGRDNKEIRRYWIPIFDKHHVDLALQGHDHAYLRTYPMKAEKRVESPAEGTVYIVSVSGTKLYDQDPRDYTEAGFTKVSTYQVLDIQLDGDRLLYRAYDEDGRLRDEFEIVKGRGE